MRASALSAGVTKRLWEMGHIVDVLEALETRQRDFVDTENQRFVDLARLGLAEG